MNYFVKYRIYLLYLVLGSVLTFYSCSENAEDVKQVESKKDFTKLNINFNNLDFNKSELLFTYRNIQDATEKSENFIKTINNEIDAVIKSNQDITNILYTLSLSDGKAVLEDVLILNAKDKLILNKPDADNYKNKSSLGINWDAILNGAGCPSGWTDNGSCSTPDCVANTTEEILEDPDSGINSSGDCTEIRYNRGLLSVRICSRSC